MKIIEYPSKTIKCGACGALLKVFKEDIVRDPYDGDYCKCINCGTLIYMNGKPVEVY